MRRPFQPMAFFTIALLASTALPAFSRSTAAAEPTKPDAQAAPNQAALDQAALEKALTERLTGATMIGKYTVEGSDAPPKEDRYRITRAVKSSGDEWLIASSVEYKGFGIPVQLKIPIRWAGDTPVMQVTDMKVPGIGTFTARVLFYGTNTSARGPGTVMEGRYGASSRTKRPAKGPPRTLRSPKTRQPVRGRPPAETLKHYKAGLRESCGTSQIRSSKD